jgi:hypothetical protein
VDALPHARLLPRIEPSPARRSRAATPLVAGGSTACPTAARTQRRSVLRDRRSACVPRIAGCVVLARAVMARSVTIVRRYEFFRHRFLSGNTKQNVNADWKRLTDRSHNFAMALLKGEIPPDVSAPVPLARRQRVEPDCDFRFPEVAFA